MGRRTALIVALVYSILISAAVRAAEPQVPLAIPGEPIPASGPPASVLYPTTLEGSFRVPRTDSALYIAAPWFVRDISITLVLPNHQTQTLHADASLPGHTLGLRLPLEAPSAERIELRAGTVSVAGVPYLVSADQLAVIAWRNWWYCVAFGFFAALAALFAWFALRFRSRATAWFAGSCAAQALLMVPWLGIVRPPPQLSQPLHGLVQSAVFVTLAFFAVTVFRALRWSRPMKVGFAVLVELNVLAWLGADLQQDYWYVPDWLTQLIAMAFDGALLAIGIAALRARIDGAAAFVAGTAFALGGYAIDIAGATPFLRSAGVAGNLLEALFFAAVIAPRPRAASQPVPSADGLTGIANRGVLDERLSTMWERAQRTGSPLSAILIGVDRFTSYNDAYGHLAGDDALIRVAFELDEVAQRNAGFAGRYAGDKFLILLAGASHHIALRVGDAARNAVAALELAHASAPSRRVSVTVGVATMIPVHAGDGAELLRRASTALHLAKTLGRDRVVAADPVLGAPAP